MLKAEKKVFKLHLKSSPQEISRVEPFLKKMNKYAHFNKKQFHSILIATTEAVNNSIVHGNLRNPEKYVDIICILTPSTIEIHILDEGKGVKKSDIPNPLDENNIFKESGRGIFIMKHFMDSVTFKKRKGGGEVILKLKKKPLCTKNYKT
ncbi:MAG: Serine-protein kinase RsbW [Ignavibacteriae bacterium]|nr:MAG: Serine-protein kinase RsbW [Ignavibacteriota bacterium]